MQPWFIATRPFGPWAGDKWKEYLAWSGLTQLQELVSLDPIICPSVLGVILPDYWAHIVQEDFMLDFFLDLRFLLRETATIERKNLLCVYRNPDFDPVAPENTLDFEFLGYDLVDVLGSASALSNCGGFAGVFANEELSQHGLLASLSRAQEVQLQLRLRYPQHPHADCHVWAVFRAAA